MLSKKISEKDWIKLNQSTCSFCKNIEEIEDIEKVPKDFIPKNGRTTTIVFDIKSQKYWLWFYDGYINDKIIYSTYSYPSIRYCPVCGKILRKETTHNAE